MGDLWFPLLFVIAGIIAGVVLLSLLFYFVSRRFFGWAALRRRALKRQAGREYEEARGTMHKRLLQQALRQPRRRKKEVERELAATEQRKSRLLEERRRAYLKQAQRAIVMNGLTDVSGIGSVLAGEIRRQVFRNALSDLHQSQRVSGVGRQKQSAISAWVRKQERRLPSVINGNFSGKAEITEQYEDSLADADRKKKSLKAELEAIEQDLEAPEAALRRLERVTKVDFIRARTDDGAQTDALDTYLRGLFAEWEPVPAWFGELITVEAEND